AMHPLAVLGKADSEISSRCNRRQCGQAQLFEGDKGSFLLDGSKISKSPTWKPRGGCIARKPPATFVRQGMAHASWHWALTSSAPTGRGRLQYDMYGHVCRSQLSARTLRTEEAGQAHSS